MKSPAILGLTSTLLAWLCCLSPAVNGFTSVSTPAARSSVHEPRFASDSALGSTVTATELPDSLEDAAERAAEATAEYVDQAGPLARCRVDFDTSVGDETYTLLKSSTEFMQNFVTACCYAMIPGLQEEKQNEMMRVVQAKAKLRALSEEKSDEEMNQDEQVQELVQVIERSGKPDNYQWKGPVCRIYFPDEGSAALARRDWIGQDNKVPECVQFSSCGGVQLNDISKDRLIFFFCPKASEAEFVEKILAQSEQEATDLQMTCFVNPNLVDMGVTGFGMAGRLLRERLIEPLQYTYYLRTLSWAP